jgi:hypothetical protein
MGDKKDKGIGFIRRERVVRGGKSAKKRVLQRDSRAVLMY